MNESSAALVYVLFGSADQASSIAQTVIGEGLAACVNMMAPCTSIYEWQGKVEHAQEIPALFKTLPEKRAALMQRIAELHDYDVPAILHWTADHVHAPYAAWLRQQTGN